MQRLRLLRAVHAVTVTMIQAGADAGGMTVYVETDSAAEAAEVGLVKFREIVSAPDEWLTTSVTPIRQDQIPKAAEVVDPTTVTRPLKAPKVATAQLSGMPKIARYPWRSGTTGLRARG